MLFVLCILAIVKSFQTISTAEICNADPVDTPITIPMGISLVVGSFVVGVTAVRDMFPVSLICVLIAMVICVSSHKMKSQAELYEENCD